MRRIKLVFATLAILVASLAAFAGPAMANELDCRNARGDLIRCDGDLYVPYDRGYYDYGFYTPYNFYNDYDFYTPYNFYNPFDYGCWEWSDVFEEWEWEDDCN
jgi:hypothetical protein